MEHNTHDPVCGMSVEPAVAKSKGHHVSHKGADYYFCSAKCKTKFEAGPEQYLQQEHGAAHHHGHGHGGAPAPAASGATSGIIYT